MSAGFEDWMENAKCRDRDPEQYSLEKVPSHPIARRSKLEWLCGGCPVISNCADYALRVELTEIVVAGIALSTYPTKQQRDQLKAIAEGVKP